ncbi:hypothetical protein PPACK8108_LOCUS4551 [Phakopsora pachyrhizi]|uniref:Uncharacterized protein n=1 Tax=Phakopsora pachyrhizi TaxID=170000 RepID=A0AAV0ANL9_PHAPC|nr:hypothetical protein PPACK8108_LOCUS4551 [Phakopsora pachyrhizi]
MKTIEIDPSLMEAEDERCYLDVLLKDENNFSPPLNDSTLDQCNHPTQAGILQLSKNLGKYAENGSQNYLNSNASIDLSISASPPGQVSEEDIYCVDSFSSSVIEIENFNQLSESHPVKKEVASVEKILKDAINQVAKKVRADSIPSEATDGLVYFIQEMICKASQDRDWVDTMYQTSSMIKERRDTVIARVLSAHKIGKPPSHPENVTSSVGPLVSTPADECNTLESAIVIFTNQARRV